MKCAERLPRRADRPKRAACPPDPLVRCTASHTSDAAAPMQYGSAASTEFRRGVLQSLSFSARGGVVYRALLETEANHHTIVQPRTLVTIEILARPSKKALRDKPIRTRYLREREKSSRAR